MNQKLINGKDLEINAFTKNIVSNSINGMIRSLKTESDVKTIEIVISNIEHDQLENASIELKTNNHSVEINEFTQGILKETTYAIVNSLKIDDEIKELKINVGE